MEKEIILKVKSILAEKPNRLSDIELWLFVTVNTAKALIDSTDKNALNINPFTECKTVSDVQRVFDMIQGRFGKKFSPKRNPVYNYLCSLIAFFPESELTESESQLLEKYWDIRSYLLYELIET